jgi:hypothetical protein
MKEKNKYIYKLGINNDPHLTHLAPVPLAQGSYFFPLRFQAQLSSTLFICRLNPTD